ncbi:IS21 family transposase [Dyadobacter jejuensis]|nr:IS21 family transposase [Dyadobacter jejuensis]
MSQIKQLIILRNQGKGIKTIARLLSMSKNTVKTYLIKLDKLVINPECSDVVSNLLKLEEPELYAYFHPGNPAYKDDRYEHFKSKIAYFFKQLKLIGVSRQILWEEYKQAYSQGYCYSQFCYHLDQCEPTKRKTSSVLLHQPAEKLFIDFAGKTISYIDASTGEIVECQLFVACLPYSDYAFAIAVRSQSLPDFLFALTRCLEHLGGAPKTIVPDNLKSAVTKTDRYEPEINQTLLDFANHYATTVTPARVRKPQDKALVENQVKILYSRVYAKLRNIQFFSLNSLNESIALMVEKHNQTRMQQKAYCREEKFLSQEKLLLTKLPEEHFELRHYAVLTVAKNNHIYLARDKHYYSVPFRLMGEKVKVVYTRSMLSVYHDGKKVAAHPRSSKLGAYSTNKEHLCSHHQHYRDRSPDYYRDLARKRSKEFYEYVTLLFQQNIYPEQLYRTCDGLLALSRKTTQEKFNMACKIAIENRICSYRFVKKMLENNTVYLQQKEVPKPLPKHGNVRGKDYYHK